MRRISARRIAVLTVVMASFATAAVMLAGPVRSMAPPQDYDVNTAMLPLGDVTGTPAANAMVDDFIADHNAQCPGLLRNMFKVYNLTLAGGALPEDGFSDHLIVRTDVTITRVRRATSGLGTGTAEYKAEVSQPNDGPAVCVGGGVPGVWQQKAGDCWARYETNRGWMDACWKQYKLADGPDASTTQDWWTWNHDASFKSKGIWWMEDAWVEAMEEESWMDWQDWDPGAQVTGPCEEGFDVSVGVGTWSIHFDYVRCEKWIPWKSGTSFVHFKESWDGGTREMREVGYAVTVHGPDPADPAVEEVPLWKGSFGFKAA